MWLMNKILNPLVRLILRSPLHRMMSASVLLITYRGRKTGKEYTLPVQYARDRSIIYIIPGMPEKKVWWRNLLGGAAVRLTLNGVSMKGTAFVVQDDEIAAVEALSRYIDRFPSTSKMYGVRLEADGSCNAQDLQKAARSTVIVKVNLE